MVTSGVMIQTQRLSRILCLAAIFGLLAPLSALAQGTGGDNGDVGDTGNASAPADSIPAADYEYFNQISKARVEVSVIPEPDYGNYSRLKDGFRKQATAWKQSNPALEFLELFVPGYENKGQRVVYWIRISRDRKPLQAMALTIYQTAASAEYDIRMLLRKLGVPAPEVSELIAAGGGSKLSYNQLPLETAKALLSRIQDSVCWAVHRTQHPAETSIRAATYKQALFRLGGQRAP